jgi:hypothetical protein
MSLIDMHPYSQHFHQDKEHPIILENSPTSFVKSIHSQRATMVLIFIGTNHIVFSHLFLAGLVKFFESHLYYFISLYVAEK